MNANHGPAYPCVFVNDSDHNTTAPDGQLVPPGMKTQLQGLSRLDLFTLHAMQALILARSAGDAFEVAEVLLDNSDPRAGTQECQFIGQHAVAFARGALRALEESCAADAFVATVKERRDAL